VLEVIEQHKRTVEVRRRDRCGREPKAVAELGLNLVAAERVSGVAGITEACRMRTRPFFVRNSLTETHGFKLLAS